MLERLLCMTGRHDWQPSPLAGGRFFVLRCRRCHAVQHGPDGREVIFYTPLPRRATRRRVERNLGKLAKRSARDDAMIAKTEREAEELQREFG